MKSREFKLKTDSFDINYESEITIDLVEEYLEDDLEIPAKFIESLGISDTYVNIKLSRSREYFNDDWYVNLQRVS
ncbi:MAG: hypothetical protein Q9M32_00295 [Sulfurimonas sp.]|nr:hypothetical protein [Sulfurimonas sp.]MDQ7060269.1 hypothetical protein [Sulfurimonas sp.]